MNFTSLSVRVSRRLKTISLLGLFIVCLESVSRAELLFDRGGGGPNQWNGAGNVHYAGFHFTEATRITGIAGWFYRTTESVPVTLRLFSLPPNNSFDPYSAHEPFTSLILDSFVFHPFSTPPEGAGGWAASETLSWDLGPGDYELRIEGILMPLGYGNYVDPIVQSQPFDYLASFYDGAPENIARYPFGLRIHGTALAAVPEPSTTGIAGVILLFGVVAYKRRQASGRRSRVI